MSVTSASPAHILPFSSAYPFEEGGGVYPAATGQEVGYTLCQRFGRHLMSFKCAMQTKLTQLHLCLFWISIRVKSLNLCCSSFLLTKGKMFVLQQMDEICFDVFIAFR